MKKALALFLAAGIGFAIAGALASSRLAAEYERKRLDEHSAWETEKALLEAAVKSTRSRSPAPKTVPPPAGIPVPSKVEPREILARLKELRANPQMTRAMRQVIHEMENLIAAGPSALPAISGFLALNEEVNYELPGIGPGKGVRDGKISTDFLAPPSLRLGLFDAVKNIGGPAAEKLLVDVLSSTGRGVEVAYLAGALQELAPNKYREVALAAAHELLANPLNHGPSVLDKNDRNYLFAVLAMFNDPSFAAQAQAQLVQGDGKTDRSALKYLQQTLAEQAIPIVSQAWQDQRVPPEQKEPLARVALSYVGFNPQAEALYQTAINDLSLPKDHRRNLIEDLNQDGFANARSPTAADLQLIENRLAFIKENAPQAADKVNAAAFAEAYKDLLKMKSPPVKQTGQ